MDRWVKLSNTSGAVSSGVTQFDLPENAISRRARLILDSGTASIDKITKIEVLAQVKNGNQVATRTLWNITGTRLDYLNKYRKATAYGTTNILDLDFGYSMMKDKNLARQLYLAVNPAGGPGYYTKVTVKVTLTSATSAVFSLQVLTGDLAPMIAVKRVIEENITYTAAEKEFSDIPYGAGENQFYALVAFVKSSAAVISPLKVTIGSGRENIYDRTVTEADYDITDRGTRTRGSDLQHVWEPIVDNDDAYLDTSKIDGTRNLKFFATSDTAENGYLLRETVGTP